MVCGGHVRLDSSRAAQRARDRYDGLPGHRLSCPFCCLVSLFLLLEGLGEMVPAGDDSIPSDAEETLGGRFTLLVGLLQEAWVLRASLVLCYASVYALHMAGLQ